MTREDEWITHVAAGTDPLTALAAVTDDDKRQLRPPCGCFIAVLAVMAAVASVWALWTMLH